LGRKYIYLTHGQTAIYNSEVKLFLKQGISRKLDRGWTQLFDLKAINQLSLIFLWKIFHKPIGLVVLKFPQNSHQNLKNIYCPCQLHMTDRIFLNTKVKNYCRILAVLSLVITRYTWSLKVKHEHILWLAGHVHVYLCLISSVSCNMVWFGFMVLNATFSNISVISWQSFLLVEETGVPVESHRPVVSNWQTLSHNVSSTPRLNGVQTYNFIYYLKSI
jgi:hypothetical protein